MISAYQLQLEYGKAPFEVKVLNETGVEFKPDSSKESIGITVTKNAVIYAGSEDGAEGQLFNLLVISMRQPEVSLQLSTKCEKKEDFKPLKIGVVGAEKKLENQFSPPNNVTKGTITLPGMEGADSYLKLEGIPVSKSATSGQSNEANTSSTVIAVEEEDGSGRAVHGFLDVQSLFVIGGFVGTLILVIALVFVIGKKREGG